MVIILLILGFKVHNRKNMSANILYCRVSTLDQKTDRQRVNQDDFTVVIEDKCSGAIPFFEREGGKDIKKLVEKKALASLSVWTIDRLGRDLRDILNTIHYFTSAGICIHFISQNLSTLDMDGKQNPISHLMISILGTVGEMERKQTKERQLEGIRIAKMKGIYKGRKKGSSEDLVAFLSKKKNKAVVDYLKKGYKAVEISQLADVHVNTVTKIKKIMHSVNQ
jgi:DNA invertase Pin-like site-specific DNA recombinase